MLRNLKHRGADESGVALVLVAIMLVAFLGMAAMAIDVGSFYQAQRQAQAAADAGALAAVQDLPSNASAATTDAQTYALQNYPSASTPTVSTPYNGNSSQVKVTVNANTPSFFGRVFGITSTKVTASAVAGTTGSGIASAVFAKTTTCSDQGVTMNGTGMTITGGVHSNGTLWANGSGNSYGATTYGGPNGCTYTANGSGNTFSSGPTADATDEAWPYDYSTLTFPSTPSCGTGAIVSSSFTWNTNNSSIPAGTYCATSGDINIIGSSITATNCTFVSLTGKITINGSGFTSSGNMFANGTNGNITLSGAGDSIDGVFESTGTNGQVDINGSGMTGYATVVGTAVQLNGSGANIQPFPGYNNLTIYQTGSQDLTINGSGYLSGGSIFAPNALISLNGSGNATGMLEGLDVTLNGSGYTITGNGPALGGGTSDSLLQ